MTSNEPETRTPLTETMTFCVVCCLCAVCVLFVCCLCGRQQNRKDVCVYAKEVTCCLQYRGRRRAGGHDGPRVDHERAPLPARDARGVGGQVRRHGLPHLELLDACGGQRGPATDLADPQSVDEDALPHGGPRWRLQQHHFCVTHLAAQNHTERHEPLQLGFLEVAHHHHLAREGKTRARERERP